MSPINPVPPVFPPPPIRREQPRPQPPKPPKPPRPATVAPSIEQVEEFFWEHYPHETSWGELREANPELYCRLLNAGQGLVLAGKLRSDYLPEEK